MVYVMPSGNISYYLKTCQLQCYTVTLLAVLMYVVKIRSVFLVDRIFLGNISTNISTLLILLNTFFINLICSHFITHHIFFSETLTRISGYKATPSKTRPPSIAESNARNSTAKRKLDTIPEFNSSKFDKCDNPDDTTDRPYIEDVPEGDDFLFSNASPLKDMPGVTGSLENKDLDNVTKSKTSDTKTVSHEGTERSILEGGGFIEGESPSLYI